MTESETCESLSDLMEKAYCLSLDVAVCEYAPNGSCLTFRQDNFASSKDIETIFAWCDGLMHGYYEKMSSGRCSVQAMVDFDIEKFEESVKRDIQMMENLKATLPPAVTLDFAEMQRRGYRGSWAGEKDVDSN